MKAASRRLGLCMSHLTRSGRHLRQNSVAAGSLRVVQFPCLDENYGFLVHDPSTGCTATIDTPEVGPILDQCSEQGWKLTHILNTHHHADHAGGNMELKELLGCTVVGPRADRDRIPGIDVEVGDDDVFELGVGGARATVFDTPGHTRGHICYYFHGAGVAFVGDTMFALGCGRLFEGTPAQMWTSMQKLLALPDDTKVYCAHEYTLANAQFALSVEPQNHALVARAEEITKMRRSGIPTVPTTIEQEKATNPFCRPSSIDLQRTIGLEGASLEEVFARTRQLKDQF